MGDFNLDFRDAETRHHSAARAASGLKRVFQKPYGIAGLGLLSGFIAGYLRREPQVDDRDLIQYLRRQQVRQLALRSSLWQMR
jgi:hypothetical protein